MEYILKYYLMELFYYSKYIVAIAGIIISAWGIRKSRKAGYIVFTIYFLLPFIMLLVSCFLKPNPELLKQKEKIDSAVQEAISEMQEEQAAPVNVQTIRVVNMPFGPLLMLIALFMLVRKEKETKISEQRPEPY